MDRKQVRRALALLIAPGDTHEIRVFPGPRSIFVNGDDLDASTDAVCRVDGTHYYSLNPLRRKNETASKSNISRRRWMLIDVDPVRPADVSASEPEKAKAARTTDLILAHLLDHGWPAPLVVDSGNGIHILFRVDLPNDKLSQQIVKEVLVSLNDKFGDADVNVDVVVHDAPRVSKLPGTWARKGKDTADRPHRQARILYDQGVLDVVPIEKLKSISEKPEAHAVPDGRVRPAPAVSPWTTQATSEGPTLANYVQTAIQKECVSASLAPVGERNARLNIAAFNLGTMASWPEISAADAQAALTRAAEQAGLDAREIRQTINSGWVAGAASPRTRPVAPGPTKPVLQPGQPLTICAEDVNPEVVSWLWEDRIAIGFISLFAGRTGVGKSFVLCDIASRLSRGAEFPDGSPPRPIDGTLFISEDPYQYVLVPRLRELGADRKKIGFMRWEAMANYSLADTDFLNAAWEERGRPSLIVIDPPANFLGGKDEHKNSEVRAVLMKIVAWLESRKVAMVLITHYNKGGAQKALDALDRIMGSVAWSSSSRVACGFMVDPGDQSKCIFGGIKNNLGPKAKALSYQIVKTPSLAKVEWLGDSGTSLDEAMNQTAPKKADAAKFFVERFTERLEWESDYLIKAAQKAGIGRDTCFEVKKALGIEGRQLKDASGRIAGYAWYVPPDWQWFPKTQPTVVDAGAPTIPQTVPPY